MGAVYILEDRATVVEYVPPERPASATCSFKDPSGTELLAPTVTVDATNIAVTAVTSSTQFSVATTLVPGRQYWWVSSDAGGQESLVRVARYASGVAYLEAPPPGNSVQVNDTIKGARCTATISAAGAATRALNNRAEWTVTGADSVVRTRQQAIHIVRCLFRDAVLPDEASRYIAGAFPNMHVDRTFGYFYEISRRASARVERKLVAGGRYQHLLGDSAAFGDAGLVALRIELALEGLVPPGYDPSDYVRKTDEELGTAIHEAISGLWYDEDDSASVDTDREVHGLFSKRLVRR